MHPEAGDAAGESGDEVDDEVAGAAEDDFDERADLVEHVHVEGDVDDAEVDEGGGEHAPVLVGAEGDGAEVGAPVEGVQGCGLGEGDAGGHHSSKDEDVDRDEGDGDGVGAGFGGWCRGLWRDGFVARGERHVVTVLASRWIFRVFARSSGTRFRLGHVRRFASG